MAARRLLAAAASADILFNETIARVVRPSIVDLWASGDDAGDTIGLALDKVSIMDTGEINLESGVNVIDVSRDQLVFGSVVGRGTLRIPVGVVTTGLVVHLSVEPIV